MPFSATGLRRKAWLAWVICVVASSAGCARRARVVAGAAATVPARPPDFRPAWMAADSSVSDDDLFTKGIVVVFFVDGATQAQRQAAIDSVGGLVVGGNPLSSGDGYYYVRIDDDGTGAQLRRAIAKLSALPQVENASLHYRILRPRVNP